MQKALSVWEQDNSKTAEQDRKHSSSHLQPTNRVARMNNQQFRPLLGACGEQL